MHRGNLPRTSGLKSDDFPLLAGLHELETPASHFEGAAAYSLSTGVNLGGYGVSYRRGLGSPLAWFIIIAIPEKGAAHGGHCPYCFAVVGVDHDELSGESLLEQRSRP